MLAANVAQAVFPESAYKLAKSVIFKKRTPLTYQSKMPVRYIFPQPFAKLSADLFIPFKTILVNIYFPAYAAAVAALIGYAAEFFV